MYQDQLGLPELLDLLAPEELLVILGRQEQQEQQGLKVILVILV